MTHSVPSCPESNISAASLPDPAQIVTLSVKAHIAWMHFSLALCLSSEPLQQGVNPNVFVLNPVLTSNGAKPQKITKKWKKSHLGMLAFCKNADVLRKRPYTPKQARHLQADNSNSTFAYQCSEGCSWHTISGGSEA